MEKCRLADLVTELGFSCEKNLAESDRVCAKCATKIRNASELMRYLKSGFLAPQEQPIAMTCSPIAAERFKRMSGSPHSAKSGKISRGDSPKENTKTTTKSKKLHNKRVHELYNKRHKYIDRHTLSIHHR